MSTLHLLKNADPGDVLAFKEQVLGKLKQIYDDYGIIENLKAAGLDFTFSTTLGQLRQFGQSDSLDEIEAIMCIEEEFEFEIADEVAEKWTNINDVVEHITENAYGIWQDKGTHTLWGTVPTQPTISVVDDSDDEPEQNDVASDPVVASDAELRGILHLPSLDEHKRFITVINVSIKEAKEMMQDFARKVESRRKIKYYKDNDDMDTEHSEWFHNFFDRDKIRDFNRDIDPAKFSADINSLSESDIPTYRGLRPLFIGDDVIGVGTTIVYNQNWATINFPDNTLISKITKIGEDHDLL